MNLHKSKDFLNNPIVNQQKSCRVIRLANQIKKDLNKLIHHKFDKQDLGIFTISFCDLSADFSNAKVYFTVIGKDPLEIEIILNKVSGFMQKKLYKLLHLRKSPVLKFIYDKQYLENIEILKLIEKANQKI
ncbi:MAG: 30S ribosome-binding factor RbfA [Bordetella sp.]|nr:MAG: 30S ribosome-binding factor RbfA [Bordetella sp.]